MKVMRMGWAAMAGLAMMASAAKAQQVVTLAPTSNQAAVLASLRPGDTLRITGTFDTAIRLARRDFGGVTINATGATLREGLLLQGVQNLSIIGGTYGRTDGDTRDWATLRIDNSANISVANTTVLGNGNMRGAGIRVAGSQYVTVRDNTLSGHLGSILMLSTTDSLVTRNRMTQSASDGIQIVDSQRVIASSNQCSNFTPGPGAHPDCIQLWSIAGRPLQSDIFVLNNSAIGTMQAFLSSDPKTGSGTRLTFGGNYAAVTTTHTVTCGACTFSSFFDNVLANLPESRWGAGSLKIGTSPTNMVGYNPLFDLRGRTDGWMPTPLWTSFVPGIADSVGARSGAMSFASAMSISNAVPEPSTWIMMGLGFALVGSTLRRRTGPRRVLS